MLLFFFFSWLLLSAEPVGGSVYPWGGSETRRVAVSILGEARPIGGLRKLIIVVVVGIVVVVVGMSVGHGAALF